jgi:prepilin-type N-terminal cleavage/methylation domain-containing protein
MTANNRTTRASAGGRRAAFTLIEIVAAITVLALIVSSSLVIINNCLAATVDMKMRMAAFELARENMEKLLGATAVPESVDYGDSNEVAGITWETRVEPFYEPHTSQMWLQAVSAASWYDTGGLLKTVEFTHWLTNLSQDDINKILNRQQEQEQALDEYAVAEIMALFKEAIDAHNAAVTEGYEEMVDLCRQLIEDYPNTAAASGARILLKNMPPAEQQRFDIKPYETTPTPLSPDSATDLPDLGSLGPDTATPDQPLIGGYRPDELEDLANTDWPRFVQVIGEIMSGKTK